jgi:NAD(P)-dependent dehydrogenase (short-subunit alcohol dehydrogenase family)
MGFGLAEAGAKIVIAQRTREFGESAVKEFKERGHTAIYVPTDVTKPEEVDALIKKTLETFGRLDIFVNNSAIPTHVPAEDQTLAQWDNLMNCNLRAVFYCSQQAARVMMKQKKGAIINIASISGIQLNYPIEQCSYHASKAGVIMLTKALAAEWVPFGIRVNCIAPGYMNAKGSKDLVEKTDIGKIWMMNVPLGRMGEPSELAGAALYLASDASSYVIGHTLVVDGGWCCC